jgi:alpha-1,6-mannosyltransferase
MQGVKEYRPLVAAAIGLSALAYAILLYYTPRSSFLSVLGLYSLLFVCFLYLKQWSALSFKQLAKLSILFQFVGLFSIPELSNDFYRFIWDGRMLFEGLNPYLYLPKEFVVTNPSVVHEGSQLVEGMGNLNASHYTVYPPLNQLCFLLPALFFSKSILGSVIFMRLILILSNVGVLLVGSRLLQKLNLNRKAIFWYALNPFVLIEYPGNLHWEGLMIFLLVLSLYFIMSKKWLVAGLFLGLSVSVKLIPLMFIPLLFRRLGLWKTIAFGAVALGVLLLLFMPFLSQSLVSNFGQSLELYFQNFEFNASIYYLAREVGFWITGYNNIKIIGRVLPVLVVVSILLIALIGKRKTMGMLPLHMLFAIGLYYALSTTIHPWYIGVPLILSVFTNFRFAVVWSFLVILSYSAYAGDTYEEKLGLVAVEYTLVFGYLIYEWILSRKSTVSVPAMEAS